MERPTMKENLKGYSLEEAHKLYTDCPELYRHIVKLDEYIDYLEDKLNNLVIADVRHSTSRKGTGLYIITMTLLCGLLGGVGWYHLGIEVGIFTLLILIIMVLASIRYNQ